MAEEPNLQVSTDVPRGATITHAYVERNVKVFGVLESEVRMISMFNTLSTAFFSASASLASIAIGIWVHGAFVEKLTPEGIILAKVVAPILCTMALIFIGLGIWARKSRGSTWQAIREESKTKN